MNKKCPRCGKTFVCRHNDIANCQCATVILSPDEKQYLASVYNDCLCAECLQKIKEEYQKVK